MSAVISIISRHDLSIGADCGNQPNKSKLALYKPLLHFNSHLRQLYTSNKTECFSYKGGFGVCGHHTHINMFKRIAGLGYT